MALAALDEPWFAMLASISGYRSAAHDARNIAVRTPSTHAG
jgi:hypothetical protein